MRALISPRSSARRPVRRVAVALGGACSLLALVFALPGCTSPGSGAAQTGTVVAKTAADGGCVEQLGLRGVAKVHLPPGHARCQAPAPQSAVARGVEPEPVFAGTTESMEVTPDPIALLDDSYGVLGP